MSIAEAKLKPESAHNLWLPMLVIAILFFLFGFVTWLNGSLIPFLRMSVS